MSNISEKSISIVNLFIPAYEACYHDFKSNHSLLESDLVIFYPSSPDYQYRDLSGYQGKDSYTEHESFRYKAYIKHWEIEIETALKNKKNIFVILSNKEEFYLKTGQKEYRSKMTTSYVVIHNNFEFLPIANNTLEIITASGSKMNFGNEYNFYDFYHAFKTDLFYSSYVKDTGKILQPFLTTPDKSRIVGGYIQKENEGCLVFLPNIDFNREDFEKANGDYNNKAIKYGEKYIQEIINIDEKLRIDNQKSPIPSWAQLEIFKTEEEKKIQNDIEEIQSQIIRAEKNIRAKEIALEEYKWVKGLLFETGKALEYSTKKALELLGFTAKNYNDGTLELDLEITSPEGVRYIGECEGKDRKDIEITKYRQLVESINRDFDREEVSSKALGILFGNPQRLINPTERTLDFTDKCKTGAKSDKIALVKTVDLFQVVKSLLENDDEKYKKKCREAIYKSLGDIVVFPKQQ